MSLAPREIQIKLELSLCENEVSAKLKCRLSQYKQNKLIELFVAGVTARTAAELVSVNKNTAAYYFHRLRLLIYHNSPHLEMFDGEVEVDESYFGGQRKGKRGRGATGKVAVFGLLK